MQLNWKIVNNEGKKTKKKKEKNTNHCPRGIVEKKKNHTTIFAEDEDFEFILRKM